MTLCRTVLIPIAALWHIEGLTGADQIYYHRLAVALAQNINENEWGAWTLWPDGQAPAGVLVTLGFACAVRCWFEWRARAGRQTDSISNLSDRCPTNKCPCPADADAETFRKCPVSAS